MFDGLLQPTHLLLILVIVIVIFGPGKLPEIGKELGKSVRGFKEAISDVTGPIDDVKGAITAPLDDVKGTVADIKDAATLTPKPRASTQPREESSSKAP